MSRPPVPPVRYELRVEGHLDERWSAWFDGMALVHEDDGTTSLRGSVADQAALHGHLARVRDLGATLISVKSSTVRISSLRSTAVLSEPAATGWPGRGRAERRSSMPTTTPTTSVQLYSVREAVADDLDGAVARLAEIGLKHVEPYAFHERTDDYLRAFAATGVTAPSGHAPVLAAETPEAILDAAVALGMATVIDPFLPAEEWQTADQVARLAERVNGLAELAAERGLEFGYHNHAWELGTRLGEQHALEVFVEHLAPEVVLEVDTYWAAVGGADVPALLAALGDRVRLIHVKDGTLDGDVDRQQPAGSGEVDVPAILAAAPGATRVIEFDAYGGDVFEGISQSLAWLSEHDR